MNSTRTCDRCGTVVPAHAPENLCLRCLFDTAVDLDDAEAPGARAATPGNPQLESVEQNTPPPVFGDYDLLAELGRGGQGVVYRARHRGLGRLVALKTIPPAHLAAAHARERFRLEASTASRLDHPNIVPIYEVGERDGFCFYSMKLVEGGNLTARISNLKSQISNHDAARLMIKVAQAVYHAHQRGVLHRDLKPSNILLDLEDEPHVSDFGLARQTDEDSSLTLSHALIGTPAYLSPEVATGGARQATVAADIYGLGAILYQLLTGQSPFARATMAETLRAVQDQEPPRPDRLNPSVPADLGTICLKCLQKEPGKRYGTAQELADDLDRFLKDEPIHARPIGPTARVWRWCRRKPALASFVAATALLLLAFAIGSPIAIYRINHERQRAERGELDARQKAYASDMNRVQQELAQNNLGLAQELLNRHRPKGKAEIRNQKSEMEKDLRGWEWRYLWRQCQGEERFILGEHKNGASAVGLLADGKTVFSAGGDKFVRLWDLESRRQIGLLPHTEEVIGAAASPDGRWLATASMKDADGQPVLLWDLATKKIAATLTTNFNLSAGSITFSPDSQWLAFATMWGGLRLWDVKAPSEVANLPATHGSVGPLGLAFSPDSRTLAYNENEFGAILLWDLVSHSVVDRLIGHQSYVTALAFSPDGQTLASGSDDRTAARLWNLAEQRAGMRFTNRSAGFGRVVFSPDGRILAMTGSDRIIRLVEVGTGNPRAELRGHLQDIRGLAFTRDGQSLLSASDDGTVRVWDLEPSAKEMSAQTFPRKSISTEWRTYGPALCLSPDGRHLLTVYTNQTFSVWDTLRLAEGEHHPLPFTNTAFAAVAAGGRLAAFGSWSGEVRLWDAGTGQVRFFARLGTNQIHRLVFSLDGRLLAVGNNTKSVSETTATIHDPRRTIRVWDVGTQQETHVLPTEGEMPVSMTFSADATALLAGFWKGSVRLWPLDGSGEAVTLPGHSRWVGGLALLPACVAEAGNPATGKTTPARRRPDGQTLISAETSIRFWDVRTRHENALKLSPRAGSYASIALSSDGRRFAAGASDGRITIWDVVSHQEVATLEGHKESVRQLAFTPDGDHLVSVSKDQLRVWRAASPAEADAATGKEARK